MAARKGGESLLRVEVRDTGIGIAAEQQELVFDAFAQADASTTRRFGGTGLGLAICRRLTEAMGGHIGVASTPGKGSLFWIEVPTATSDAGTSEEDLGWRQPPAGARILVVDDNATNRLVLERQLGAWHLDPETTADPVAALGRLRAAAEDARPFDVALVDFCMPGMDGLQLARAVADDPAIASTPVLLLTSANPPARGDLERAGVNEWLSKPVRGSELYDRLVRLLHPVPVMEQAGAARAPSSSDTPRRGRVLVVEDNPVNQLVAKGMAEKLGYQVDVVDDGEAALGATARLQYTAVLMDCHMPVMDGFEATRAIRAGGGRDGRLPVIAMTAGAMGEDRDRCLEAGMDDYLSKPVSLAELEASLARWSGAGAPAPAPAPAPAAPEAHGGQPPLDAERLQMLRSLGAGVFEAMAAAFLKESASGLEEVRRAFDDDSDLLAKAAHRLKGSAGNIGAARAEELCRQLEAHARQGARPASRLLEELDRELARTSDALREEAGMAR
jgi:CheY-like chemotaxis protein